MQSRSSKEHINLLSIYTTAHTHNPTKKLNVCAYIIPSIFLILPYTGYRVLFMTPFGYTHISMFSIIFL